MIKLTRLSRATVILNSDLIEHIEETPDTVITLTSGQKLMVLESAEDIVRKIVEFRAALANRINCAASQTTSPDDAHAAAHHEEPCTHGRQ